jgi:hypothetical protein
MEVRCLDYRRRRKTSDGGGGFPFVVYLTTPKLFQSVAPLDVTAGKFEFAVPSLELRVFLFWGEVEQRPLLAYCAIPG